MDNNEDDLRLVSTEEELLRAVKTSGSIGFNDNLSVNVSALTKNLMEGNGEVILELQGNTLTLIGDGTSLLVGGDGGFGIIGGTVFNSSSPIIVSGNAELALIEVVYNGQTISAEGDGVLTVINSEITSDSPICINMTKGMPKVEIENSLLIGSNAHGTVIFSSVESIVGIKNTEISGHWQGVVMRCGTADIENIKINISLDEMFEDYNSNPLAWKDGNGVACGAVVVGTTYDETEYKADAKISLVGTSIYCTSDEKLWDYCYAIYAIGGLSSNETVLIADDFTKKNINGKVYIAGAVNDDNFVSTPEGATVTTNFS